jgi:beta-lactamase class C
MKILRETASQKSLATTSVRHLLKSVGLCLLMSVSLVNAQNEKKISYSVPLQIERTAASSAPAAPVYKAPEPVIRPIEDASTTPAVTRKKPTTKTTSEQATKTTQVASEKKSTAKVTKPETTKKATTAKTEKSSNVEKKPVNTQKAAVAKKTPVVTSKTPAKNTPTATTNVKSITTPPPAKTPQVANAARMAIVPIAAASLAAAELAEGNQLTEGTLDDEDFSSGAELDSDTKTPARAAPATAASTQSMSLAVGGPREKFVQEFKNYVETKLVPRVPGLAVAVIADGKIKVLQAYGVKKVGTNDPINTDTAFRLASVSKSIAGTMAGVMVSDGLLTWDTPITSVLPDVEFSNPRYGNQLTLRNIMSQSTGLPTHAGDNYIEEGLPFDAVMEKFKKVNFVCPPGKCYSYQNVTMSLLANIVQKKTGKPYEQYVKEKLFTPLGMRTASIGLEGLFATKNYALPHEITASGKWYTKEITEHYYRLNPAAGGNASISDMARWVLAHMGHNPEVLSPATLQAVHAKATKNTPAQSHYGAREGVTDTHYAMGFRTFDYRGDKNFLHHGGYVFGSRSEMVFNPELQIGMVILSNSNRLPGSVVFEFLDSYEDEKRGEKRPSLVQAVKQQVKPKPKPKPKPKTNPTQKSPSK